MAFTLAFPDPSVPSIPDNGARARAPDRHEHFGTEDAALARAAVLMAGNEWFDLRLYGPDGRRIADRHGLRDRLAGRPVESVPAVRDAPPRPAEAPDEAGRAGGIEEGDAETWVPPSS